MKTTFALGTFFRMTAVMLTLVVFSIAGYSQTLTIQTGASFSGNGTLEVKGTINNSAISDSLVISGTTSLMGTTQNIGAAGGGPLSFATLQALGTGTKTMIVNVTVADALVVNNGGGNYLDIVARTLHLGGTSTLTSGSLNVSNAGNTVNFFKSSGAQTVLGGLTYAGALNLTGNATKSLSGDITAATATQSGGAVTVDQNFTITGASTFAAVADVSATKKLDLGTTATLSTVSANNGTIEGGSGLTTISTLSGNSGTISGAGGGAITFTNAATNGGAITGGAGAVTFSNTLAHSAGTITAGSGSMTFSGVPTIASGATITAGTGTALDFNANIANSGTISLTGTGSANFNGDFTSTGTLTFASGSAVTFDGAAQSLPAATFGNLTLAGSASKTAGGSLTVAGNLTLTQGLAMGANTLTFSQAASTVSGADEVTGAVSRTHTFASGSSYAFNRADVTLAFGASEDADMSISMSPATDPSNLPSTKYVSRKYAVSGTPAASVSSLKLYYTDTELNNVSDENKVGIRSYNGSAWSKFIGTYTRSNAGATNTILLSSITTSPSGSTEFGMFGVDYNTIVDASDWNTAGTWDEGAVPASDDDVTIRNTGITISAAGALANNVTINSGKSLTVSSGNLTVGTLLTNSGTLTVDASRVAQVKNFTNAGSLVNNGRVTVTD